MITENLNTPVTLTLKQILDLTTANTNQVLEQLGYNKWIHRAELERTSGFSRRKVDMLIIKGKLTPHKRPEINSNKMWFLRSQVAELIEDTRK